MQKRHDPTRKRLGHSSYGWTRERRALMTLHGDHDPYVPFAQSVRVKEALDRASVPCQILRVPAGGHGDLSERTTLPAWQTIREFLARLDLLPSSATRGVTTP